MIRLVLVTFLVFFIFLLFEAIFHVEEQFLGSKHVQSLRLTESEKNEKRLKGFAKRVFQAYEEAGKKALSRLELDMEEFGFWFLSKRNRVLVKKGKGLDDDWVKGWEKHFLLGLRKGSPVFEQKITSFYPRPVSPEIFQGWEGKLVPFPDGMQRRVLYFQRKESLLFFAILEPDALASIQDSGADTNHTAKSFDFRLDLTSLVLKRFPLFLALLLIFFFLQKGLLPSWFLRSFQRKFALLYFPLIALLFLFVYLYVMAVINAKKFEIQEDLRASMEKFQTDMEKRFTEFRDGFARERLSEFNPKAGMSEYTKYKGLKAARISPVKIQEFYPEKPAYFFEQYMLRISPRMLTQQMGKDREFETKIFHSYAQYHSFDPILQQSIDIGLNLANFFKLEREGTVQSFLGGGVNNFFFWKRLDFYKDYQVLVMSINEIELREIYLEKILKSFKKRNLPFDFSTNEVLTPGENMNFRLTLASRFFDREFHYSANLKTLYRELDSFHQQVLFMFLLGFLLAIPSCYYMSKALVDPLRQLETVLQKSLKQEFLRVDASSQDEYGVLARDLNHMLEVLEEKQTLSTFVANQILHLLSNEEGELQEQLEDEAVVLFSDIRSFTTISESYPPEEIVSMLNDYFEIWQNAIERRGGVLEKFIGDAVVAVFFKRESPHFYQQAVQAALDVMEELPEFNQARKDKGEFVVTNGVGLALGPVSFSVVGNHLKKHLLATGDCVFYSERLEEVSRHGTSSKIFVDRGLFEKLEYNFDFVSHENLLDEVVYELNLK